MKEDGNITKTVVTIRRVMGGSVIEVVICNWLEDEKELGCNRELVEVLLQEWWQLVKQQMFSMCYGLPREPSRSGSWEKSEYGSNHKLE